MLLKSSCFPPRNKYIPVENTAKSVTLKGTTGSASHELFNCNPRVRARVQLPAIYWCQVDTLSIHMSNMACWISTLDRGSSMFLRAPTHRKVGAFSAERMAERSNNAAINSSASFRNSVGSCSICSCSVFMISAHFVSNPSTKPFRLVPTIQKGNASCTVRARAHLKFKQEDLAGGHSSKVWRLLLHFPTS